MQVRWFAGAAAAAGTTEETLDPPIGQATVREVLLAAHPGVDAVLVRCTVLVDGRRVGIDEPWPAGTMMDVLPPFAGG